MRQQPAACSSPWLGITSARVGGDGTLERWSARGEEALRATYRFFLCEPSLKSLWNLLQYCFCFVLVFWPGGRHRNLSSLTQD